MSNYPDGTNTADAPWNRPDARSVESRCTVCDRLCISADEGCTWKDEHTAKYVDGDRTPDGHFVCSTACSSQAMFEAATDEERAALRLLARWNESMLILQKAFLAFNPYQKQMDIKHASVWERWNNAYDILKLHKLMEKIGAEMTGENEVPPWYNEAVSAAPERKPVQSVPLRHSPGRHASAG
jgi:hypothetical protein